MKKKSDADKKIKELVSQRKYNVFLKSINKFGKIILELKANKIDK